MSVPNIERLDLQPTDWEMDSSATEASTPAPEQVAPLQMNGYQQGQGLQNNKPSKPTRREYKMVVSESIYMKVSTEADEPGFCVSENKIHVIIKLPQEYGYTPQVQAIGATQTHLSVSPDFDSAKEQALLGNHFGTLIHAPADSKVNFASVTSGLTKNRTLIISIGLFDIVRISPKNQIDPRANTGNFQNANQTHDILPDPKKFSYNLPFRHVKHDRDTLKINYTTDGFDHGVMFDNASTLYFFVKLPACYGPDFECFSAGNYVHIVPKFEQQRLCYEQIGIAPHTILELPEIGFNAMNAGAKPEWWKPRGATLTIANYYDITLAVPVGSGFSGRQPKPVRVDRV